MRNRAEYGPPREKQKHSWALCVLGAALLLPVLGVTYTLFRPVHLSLGPRGVYVGRYITGPGSGRQPLFHLAPNGFRVKVQELGAGGAAYYDISWW